MENQRLRIGAVSYLNTKPLVYGLADSDAHQLSFDLPSRLADQLSQRKLDVALVPSIEFLLDSDYVRVSDACIGCLRAVHSVKLYSRVPAERIQTLALDEGSRTSAAMVQIWLADHFSVRPQLHSLPIGDGLADASTDAVLLIGDRAIGSSSDRYPMEWDLGEQWVSAYKTPFVFAVWTARRDTDVGDLDDTLSMARDAGVANLPQIAASECRHVGMNESECLTYLSHNLHFRFGAEQNQGLELFRKRADHYGFLTQPAT